MIIYLKQIVILIESTYISIQLVNLTENDWINTTGKPLRACKIIHYTVERLQQSLHFAYLKKHRPYLADRQFSSEIFT